MKIELINFSLYEDEKELLTKTNWLFNEEKYQLTAKSGAGKSSLFNAIYKLHNNYSGEILINNINIKDIDTKTLRKKYITYINEDDEFLDTLSIKENVKLFATDYNMACLVLEQMVNITGFDINCKIKTLSSQERYFLNILMGLYSPTKICLIDEPYNNISPAQLEKFMELINSCNKLIIITGQQKIKCNNLVRIFRSKLVAG